MRVTVFGGINMDLVARAPRLPAPGETLVGYSFYTVPGGKGANQAVACARLGAATTIVGRVGGDEFGQSLLQSLEGNGVDTAQVAVDEGISSGVAVIAVDDAAENSIIVIPGANGRVGEQDLARLEIALTESRLLLLQLEIPLSMVTASAELAKLREVTVVFDPAPAASLPQKLYGLVDIMTPNETEAAALVGYPIRDLDCAATAAEVLLARGVGRVIIKMGSLGAYAADATGGEYYPAIPVSAVDTVAAGDAFNGALAVALAEGRSFEDAMGWALAGGACAVTREGAQPSMPDREALLAVLAGAKSQTG
jgi:ribokinase